MKNICFFNSIRFWGGGEKLHLENAIEFNNMGYNVLVLANPKSLLWSKSKEANLKLYPIKVSNLSFLNPFKIFRLSNTYKKFNIDTIIFSSSQDLKLGSISAKLAGVEKIVYLRGLATAVKANFINRFIFKSCLTHIIANSNETKRQILKHLYPYISNEKVHTIYHGIKLDTTVKDKLVIIKSKGRGVILGNAGRLTQQKGQKDLIRLAKILMDKGVDFTLFIAGEGELRSELEEMIAHNNLQERVILLGFVEDMDRFMSSIDIFLLTSAWEGFGFVLVEAMMKSKPVIAYDITSNPEIIDDGVTGYLVEYSNIEMLADKSLELINSSNLRESMGISGLKRVKDKFILQDRINEIENYLSGKD